MEIVFAADAAAEPKVSSIPSPSAPPSSRGTEAALERDAAGGAALRCAGVAFRTAADKNGGAQREIELRVFHLASRFVSVARRAAA